MDGNTDSDEDDEFGYKGTSMAATMAKNINGSSGKNPSSIDTLSNNEIDVLSMSFASDSRRGSIEAQYANEGLQRLK